MDKFGAGRGSDTEGAAARNSRPTSSESEEKALRGEPSRKGNEAASGSELHPSPECGCDICGLVKRTLATFS